MPLPPGSSVDRAVVEIVAADDAVAMLRITDAEDAVAALRPLGGTDADDADARRMAEPGDADAAVFMQPEHPGTVGDERRSENAVAFGLQ